MNRWRRTGRGGLLSAFGVLGRQITGEGRGGGGRSGGAGGGPVECERAPMRAAFGIRRFARFVLGAASAEDAFGEEDACNAGC